MARQNEFSLSWFKKRTAQINRELRVSTGGKRVGFYSPTVEYRRYQTMKQSGGTEFTRKYGGIGDFRSAAGRAAVSRVAGADLRDKWQPFAQRNRAVAAIIDWLGTPNAYVDERTGRVYQITVGKDGKKHYTRLLDHGRTKALKGRPPANLKPLDNTTASRALANKAKQVKKRKQGGGGGGANGDYQDV